MMVMCNRRTQTDRCRLSAALKSGDSRWNLWDKSVSLFKGTAAWWRRHSRLGGIITVEAPAGAAMGEEAAIKQMDVSAGAMAPNASCADSGGTSANLSASDCSGGFQRRSEGPNKLHLSWAAGDRREPPYKWCIHASAPTRSSDSALSVPFAKREKKGKTRSGSFAVIVPEMFCFTSMSNLREWRKGIKIQAFHLPLVISLGLISVLMNASSERRNGTSL